MECYTTRLVHSRQEGWRGCNLHPPTLHARSETSSVSVYSAASALGYQRAHIKRRSKCKGHMQD